MNHELTVEKLPAGLGWVGECSCSDPDWGDEGTWVGQVTYHAHTEEDVREFHYDHVLEVAE